MTQACGLTLRCHSRPCCSPPHPSWRIIISGTVYCDQDLDNTIDAGDTPVSGIDVQITSLDEQPSDVRAIDGRQRGLQHRPADAHRSLPGGAPTLIQGSGVTIRGTKATRTLPIVQPFGPSGPAAVRHHCSAAWARDLPLTICGGTT